MPQDVGCKFFNEYKLCYQTLRRGGAKSGPRKIITVHKQFIFNNEHFSSQIPAKIFLIVFTSYETSVRHCYMLQDNSILCQVERMITEWSVKVWESLSDIEDVGIGERITNDWTLKGLYCSLFVHNL